MRGTRRGIPYALFTLAVMVLLAIALTGCGVGAENTRGRNNIQRGDHERSLLYDGLERTYLLHLPPGYDGNSPLPLVMVLHGGTRNARDAVEMTGMSDKADQEGFIAVYPDGTGFQEDRLFTWNADFCCGYAMRNDIDDAGFLRALIEDLQEKLAVDPCRIYVTGISNGAMMAYLLGSESSDIIAAIAPVAGSIGGRPYPQAPLEVIPPPQHPVSVIAFHGEQDKLVPYKGGQGSRSLSEADYLPVDESVDFWVKHDGCDPDPETEISGNGNIIVETYTGGENGTEVVLYTIVNGGHAWPGAMSTIFGDEPIGEISATDLIWDFFANHPK